MEACTHVSIVIPAGAQRRAGIGEPLCDRWLPDPGYGLSARSGMTKDGFVCREPVDGRDKPGHDAERRVRP